MITEINESFGYELRKTSLGCFKGNEFIYDDANLMKPTSGLAKQGQR